jgi:hypothetical protein
LCRHPFVVLLQPPDGVAEQDLSAGHLAQRRDQVAAHDLHRAGIQVPHVDARDGPVGRVHELDAADVGRQRADPRHDPHPLRHLARLAAHVHPVAVGPQRGGALDHGGLEPVPGEPVGQGQAGDARSGNQDPLVH